MFHGRILSAGHQPDTDSFLRLCDTSIDTGRFCGFVSTGMGQCALRRSEESGCTWRRRIRRKHAGGTCRLFCRLRLYVADWCGCLAGIQTTGDCLCTDKQTYKRDHKQGKSTFYCTAWSNVRSVRNAVKSGFIPAWVEMTAKPANIVDEMNL